MEERAWEDARRKTLVCVDSYHKGILEGRFYNPGQEPERFESLSQFLNKMETIRTAISAAETGHTVIATLHTRGAVNAIDRVIDAFPSTQQSQIRTQLAAVLRTVVSQQLLPDMAGGLVPACELLQCTPAVRSLIRDNRTHQLPSVIAAGGKDGMISMDQAILRLYRAGTITWDTALLHADNPEQLKRNG